MQWNLKISQERRYAINALLEKQAKIEDIDLFEINEAFAAVAIASTEIAGIDPEKLNVNGGAVAMGHQLEQAERALSLH